jgi:hypothetical protein
MACINPHYSDVSGLSLLASDFSTSDVWRSRTLKLTSEAKRVLFPKGIAKLWAIQPDENQGNYYHEPSFLNTDLLHG